MAYPFVQLQKDDQGPFPGDVPGGHINDAHLALYPCGTCGLSALVY